MQSGKLAAWGAVALVCACALGVWSCGAFASDALYDIAGD